MTGLTDGHLMFHSGHLEVVYKFKLKHFKNTLHTCFHIQMLHIEGKPLGKKILADDLQFVKFSPEKFFHCTSSTNPIYPAVTY